MVPYARCRRCGRHRDQVGKISRQGNCFDCGVDRLERNIRAIHTRQGDEYERWRSGVIRWALGLPGVPQ